MCICCLVAELHAYTLPQDKTQNAYEDAKIKAKQEAKDLGSTAKSEVDKYADKAFDKARGIHTLPIIRSNSFSQLVTEFERATRTPGKPNMVAFAAAGGAIGALGSMLFLKNSSFATRMLAAAGAAGGGAYLGSKYSRRDVVEAVRDSTNNIKK